jgi:hypothetical protein
MKQQKVTALAKVSLVALLAGCAISNTVAIPGVPEVLNVPESQVLSLETQATGVQIYECKASKDDPMRLEWA